LPRTCPVLLSCNASGTSSSANALEPHRDLSGVDYPCEFRKTPGVWFHTHVRCPDRWARLWDRAYCLRTADKAPDQNIGGFSFLRVLQVKRRADERTRTADLVSSRVCSRAFLSVAEDCKCRINKRFLVRSVARYCTTLCAGWGQPRVSTPWIIRSQVLCKPDPRLGYCQFTRCPYGEQVWLLATILVIWSCTDLSPKGHGK